MDPVNVSAKFEVRKTVTLPLPEIVIRILGETESCWGKSGETEA